MSSNKSAEPRLGSLESSPVPSARPDCLAGERVERSAELTESDLIQMYRWMVLTRAFEDRASELWAEGRVIETVHGSQGQEAIAVGACYGLDRADQVLPSLRTRGAFLVKGVTCRTQMAGMFAKSTGPARSKTTAHHMADPEAGVLLGSAIVGASITVGVGAALALKMQGRANVVVEFFGDGAAERGDFHEALNFAGVFRLPVVFVLENNGYAEMTPLKGHFAGSDFARRADGYGFLGLRIDGNDALVVYDAVQEAVGRARAGQGPTLIECVTYRQRGHTAADSPTELRDPVEVEEWLGKDPITRMRAVLMDRGILTEVRVAEIEKSVRAEIDDAVQFATESPPPTTEEVLRDVYVPATRELVIGKLP
jgi:pyruvate dehydrogenase E1 component alpha subunit